MPLSLPIPSAKLITIIERFSFMANPLKAAYRHLSRFPWVVRFREAYRQNVQMHDWSWSLRKPRLLGTDPSGCYKHELTSEDWPCWVSIQCQYQDRRDFQKLKSLG